MTKILNLNELESQKQNFFGIFAFIFSFFYIRFYIIVLIGFNLFIWLLTYIININVSQDLVVLHYNVDFGVDLIGSVKRLFIMPLLGLIIILINIMLLAGLSRHEDFKFIAHLLFVASLMANLFLFVALASIYLANFI